MRDTLRIIFFMVFVMIFIVITAMVTLHFWPNFISPDSFSDVIVLFGILIAVIATINIGIFELNKKEIDARANDCLAEVKKITEEEQMAINATAYYTAAQALWVYYYRHKSGNLFWKEHFQQMERRITDLENEIRHQKVDVAEETTDKIKSNEGTVAKLKFFEVGSNGYAILSELIKNGILEDVSSTEVRLKPNVGLKENTVREIAKDDFGKVWAILQQSHEIDEKVENYYKDYLNEAIGMANRSVREADKLNILKHEEIICKCKNNLAFFLAARGNDSDAGRARDLGNYNYQVVTSERLKTLKNPYIYQATWALVLWRFYKKDEVSRKEAYRIAKELIGNAEISLGERDRLKDRWTFIRGQGKTFDQLMEELKGC